MSDESAPDGAARRGGKLRAIGAELFDDGQGVGTACVAQNRTDFPMPGTLALMPDDVPVGLLDEYAEAIAMLASPADQCAVHGTSL
jgi:hypothetical protein